MLDEFEIESEVRDIEDKRPVAAPDVPYGTKGEGADETSHTAIRDSVADGGKPDNGGQDGPPPIPFKDKLPREVKDALCCWAPEMDWLFSLMSDKGLIRLRDVVKFRQDKEEYYLNPKCHISCATMEYVKTRIDAELKLRREEGIKVEY